MFKQILGIAVIIFLLFSCKNKKSDIEIVEQHESALNDIMNEPDIIPNVIYESFSEDAFDFFQVTEYEEVPKEIYDILFGMEEKYLNGRFTEILFIHKVNFGVPDGDNYIVLWKEQISYDRGYRKEIYLYSISDKIEKRFRLFTGLQDEAPSFNISIMENIPGIHIGDIGASVFDCNGDGKDKLFSYGFYGRGNWIHVFGYNEEKDEIVDYCDEFRVVIIGNNREYTPVEFTYYKKRNGFKVFSLLKSSMPPVNPINDYYAYYFFAWNRETKQYENIGEYLVDEIGNEYENRYNIHDYDIEHFIARIHVESLSNMEALINLEEITANHVGGRSFQATMMAENDESYYGSIFDFDSEGKYLYRIWDGGSKSR
ncbi:MAG: hypothetical protein LBH44_02160 [Treponema sp.]|jgi:hypothetical protein|nr:hypothetical protein [Treponema sp.]